MTQKHDVDSLPLLARVKRFDAGTELGPHVVLAGIVEGTGPLAGLGEIDAVYLPAGFGEVGLGGGVVPPQPGQRVLGHRCGERSGQLRAARNR